MKNNLKFGSRQHKPEVFKTNIGGFINLGFNFDRN